jgi:hypothetical protein
MDDLSQPCPIGRLVGDYRLPSGNDHRRETIAEVIADNLAYDDNMTEAVSLICRAARGENIYTGATDLLLKLANSWAEQRSEL